MKELNKIDRNILRTLQADGRVSYAELARKVGLTTTPCIERVRRLARTSQDSFEQFKSAAVELPEVQECYLVSGNFDYLIKARVADMTAYRTFLGETLLGIAGIQEATSYVVMETVKETLNLSILEPQ